MSASACAISGCTRPARAKGKCTTHYASARRNTPGNRQLGPRGGVMLPPLRLDPRLDLLMRAAVDLEGATLAAWVRDAIAERVLRQSAKHPQLRELGALVVDEH